MSSEKKRLYKIVVANPAEAVSLIQRRFGTGATVQSVKQHRPKGVSKLWSAPNLEIIVSVPDTPGVQEPFKIESEKSTTPDAPQKEVSSEPAMPDIEEVTRSERPAPPPPKTQEKPIVEDSTNWQAALPDIESLLLESAFDKALVQRLKTLPQWETISQRSLKQGLTELIALLREEFIAAQNVKLGNRVAFVGMAGTGKTTLLRKYVANRVFVHGKKAQILKLDDDDPNPDELLNIFCELIGVDLIRDPSDLIVDKDTEVFVDLPGLTLNHPDTIRMFSKTLDKLEIHSRVLVINSLYDSHTISNSYDIARHMRATHQVFTHLDELGQWAKLWKFVLRGSLPLIFLNMGNESSASPREEFLPLLISKTFPKILLN